MSFFRQDSAGILSGFWLPLRSRTAFRRNVCHVSCDAQPGKGFGKLHDENANTCYQLTGGTRLKIQPESAVSGIYCIFQMPCEWKVILPDGSVKNGGADGFIHEYVAFDRSVDAFEMEFPDGARFGELYAFADGRIPDWVQVWEPPCEKADLMVVPTHADDEYLWFGGAIPYYAGELGYNVQVVYLTNHNNARYRCHELLDGLWTVGVRHYPVMNSPFLDDKAVKSSYKSAKEYYGYEKVLAFQVEMLRRFSPRVVLGHDIGGEYGHGAHQINARTLLEAVTLTSDPASFPESAEKYGTCTVEKCYLHLWKENPIEVTWSRIPLSRFGGKSSFDVAYEGYACHKSQGMIHLLQEEGPNDCRLFGLAYTTVGSDTPGKNDMFEQIDMPAGEEEGQPEGDSAVSTETDVSESDVRSDDSAEQREEATGRSTVFSRFTLVIAAVLTVLLIVIVTVRMIILRQQILIIKRKKQAQRQ